MEFLSFTLCPGDRKDGVTRTPEPFLHFALLYIQVTEGMELLERLNQLPTNNYDRAPLATVKVEKVTRVGVGRAS